MRIGLLQFTPHHSQPDKSREKVLSLCSHLKKGDVDLLVAPEMALTGYVFRDREEIAPLCEDVSTQEGVTIGLAKELAQRLGCYTIMGFPEVVNNTESGKTNDKVKASEPHDARPTSTAPASSFPQYFNSALLTSPAGQILHTFRKHFLFMSDEVWSSDGPGFQIIDLPFGQPGETIRVCTAICMDLNPFQFKTDFEAYELTKYCDDQEVDLLFMPMAWLKGEEGKTAVIPGKEEDPEMPAINYWAQRCHPFWKAREGKSRKTILATCNRTGTESGEFLLAYVEEHGTDQGSLPLCTLQNPSLLVRLRYCPLSMVEIRSSCLVWVRVRKACWYTRSHCPAAAEMAESCNVISCNIASNIHTKKGSIQSIIESRGIIVWPV